MTDNGSLRHPPIKTPCVGLETPVKTGHLATIYHTSDGGAVSGGQADVKPEAASGGSPEG
jgi:hypothetical protein